MRIAIALAVSVLAFTGCKKKEGSGDQAAPASTDKAAAKPDEAKPADPKPAEGGKPIAMDAPALFDDYNKPGQDGLALLEKWRPGAVVTGTVSQVMAQEGGKATLWLDAGANHKMSVDFTDGGKAATDKGVKKGDKVTALCQIGGSDGALMMLVDCELK
jgi:hypothetical protein